MVKMLVENGAKGIGTTSFTPDPNTPVQFFRVNVSKHGE